MDDSNKDAVAELGEKSQRIGKITDTYGRKPGMTADVRILIEKRPKVLVLPIEAVITEKGKSLVHRLQAQSGNKAGSKAGPPITSEQVVTLGARNDREVEITKGLEEGQQVMIKPPKADEREKPPKARKASATPTASPTLTMVPPPRWRMSDRRRSSYACPASAASTAGAAACCGPAASSPPGLLVASQSRRCWQR